MQNLNSPIDAHRSRSRYRPQRGLLLAIVATALAFALLASSCGSNPSDRGVAEPGPAAAESATAVPEPTVVEAPAEEVVSPAEQPTPEKPTPEQPTPEELPIVPANAPSTPAATAVPTQVPPAPPVAPAPPSAPTVPPAIAQATPPLPSINVGCTIAPRRQVKVRENLVFTATQTPSSPAVDFTFDHGDGTLDRTAVSHAYYLAPGSYKVNLNWSYGGRSGRLFCGTVDVVSPTPTPSAPAGMSITCDISPKRTVVVGELLTLKVGQVPGNVAVNYTFDHGDGTRDSGPLSQAYYSAPGVYAVKLNWAVTGRTGTILCGNVTVVAAPTPGVSVQCTIAPARDVVVGETLTFRAQHSPANAAVSYAFDHGDGTVDARAVSTAFYERPGRYNVNLSWTHAGRTNRVFCGTVTVVSGNPAPSPAVDVACTIWPKRDVLVRESLTYTAHNNPSNVAVSFSFDHGDGTIDPRAVSTAYYEAPGTYYVMLNWRAGSRYGSVFCGAVRVVAATPDPAVAIGCAVSPKRRIQVGETVTFVAQQAPSNLTVSYTFDHGDGTIVRQPVSNATYDAPGTYIVTLRWSHSNGSGTTPCGSITVDPATP